jgi:replicative DNA helicase
MMLRSENPDTPILLLASHNRGEAKRPYAPGRGLGAYKETGAIEYVADRALNLEYTDQSYDRWRNGDLSGYIELNLILLKNRLGRPGRVELRFNGAFQSFRMMEGQAYRPQSHASLDPAGKEDGHEA